MKQGELNALAHSLCGYLLSRNNDIDGYCGLGVLCALSQRQPVAMFRFRMVPGEPVVIGGCTLMRSKLVTDNLVKFDLDSITGQMTFSKLGPRPGEPQWYMCTVAIAVSQGGRTGIDTASRACWAHEPTLERRSTRPDRAE